MFSWEWTLTFWLWLPITVGVSQGTRLILVNPPAACLFEVRSTTLTAFLSPLSEYNVFLTAGSGWKIIVAIVISRSWRYSALL